MVYHSCFKFQENNYKAGVRQIRESGFFHYKTPAKHRREILNEEENKKQNENAAGGDTKLQGYLISHAVPEQKEITVAI